jgi:hypothetical protein
MPITVTQIYRYPVKGLTGEPLDRVHLEPGATLPGDRRFAIALGSAAFDGEPHWLPKGNFLNLSRNERLARLESRFDDNDQTLTLLRGGKQVCRAKLSEPTGRAIVEQFFAAFAGSEARGTPRLIEVPDQPMSDVPEKVLSLINLASVRDLERVVTQPVDPLRFRGNLYIDGGEAWEEFTWVGRTIAIGAARLRVTQRIDRCAATNVNPATAERDRNIPRALMQGFGHGDCGVYAEVTAGGEIAPGAVITPED